MRDLLHVGRLVTLVKNWGKTVIGLAAAATSPVRAELGRSFVVFVYHDVSDAPSPFSRDHGLAVSVQQFTRQIQDIASMFHVISLDELLAGRVPRRAALLTFDDGFLGVVRHALPILRGLGVPSTIFLNMAPVRGEPFWAARVTYLCHHMERFLEFLAEQKGREALVDPHLACSPAVIRAWEGRHGDQYLEALPAYAGRLVSADDLAAVDGDPLVTFGSHAYHHYNLLELTDAEVEADVEANAAALSAYRSTRAVFAFPFGVPGRSFAQRHVDLLLRMGYERLFTGLSLLNQEIEVPVLHRLSLTGWHDRRSRIWYQMARAAFDGRVAQRKTGSSRLPGRDAPVLAARGTSMRSARP